MVEVGILQRYVWPDDPIPRTVIGGICILAVYWAYWCRSLHLRIKASTADLAIADQVGTILAERAAKASQTEGFSPGGGCDLVVREYGMRADSPVAKHLRTLFVNGYNEARLDIAELNRRTVEEVLQGEAAIRVQLSVFVIIGLLGTLFGIANAVVAFRGHVEASGPGQIDPARLLEGLTGVFTPSIWGVAISIAGSLLYSFMRSAAAQFSFRLRALTVESLAPLLMPTHTQRMAEAAANAVQAAEQVARFAEGIEVRTHELTGSVANAADSAKTISSAMGEMSKSVAAARSTVDGTLTGLSDKIAAFSATLDRWAEFENQIDANQRLGLAILADVKAQNQITADAIQAMQTSIASSINKLDETARSLYAPVEQSATRVTTAAAAFSSTCSQLVQNLSASSKAQSEVLGAEFREWRSEINERAGDAKNALDALKEPFEKSAYDLRDEALKTLTQMTTMMNAWNSKQDALVNALREVTGPLVAIAQSQKAVPPAQDRSQPEIPVVRLSAEDRRLLESLGGPLRGVAGLDSMISMLDTRFGRLEQILAAAHLPSRSPADFKGSSEKINTIPKHFFKAGNG